MCIGLDRLVWRHKVVTSDFFTGAEGTCDTTAQCNCSSMQNSALPCLLYTGQDSTAVLETVAILLSAIRYDTIRDAILTCTRKSKAYMSQLNLPHGTDN